MKYFAISLMLICALAIILIVLKGINNHDHTEINKLKTDNFNLQVTNIKLNEEIDSSEKNINAQDSLIKKLYTKQDKLYYRIDTLNNKIKNINEKYEKASKFSDSLNTYQLKRYFSNLK
jgi:peptidoglycan hydrolase CwlO-like protein